MNGNLGAVVDSQGGVFTTAQAYRCGLDAQGVSRKCRTGEWRRLRRGAYTLAGRYEQADPIGRHLLLLRAVLLAMPGRVAISHASAMAAYGVDLWSFELSQVHVTRSVSGSGRREGGVHHHVGALGPDDIVVRDGIALTRPARSVLETAGPAPFEAGVAMADSALRLGLTTQDELRATALTMTDWPHSRNALAVAAFADGRSESVGESRLRVLLAEEGLPAPVLQQPFHDRDGDDFARVDFWFPDQKVIVEFDGRVKYEGSEGKAALYAEKRREDRLREQVRTVRRFGWEDLGGPRRRRTGACVRRVLGLSGHRAA